MRDDKSFKKPHFGPELTEDDLISSNSVMRNKKNKAMYDLMLQMQEKKQNNDLNKMQKLNEEEEMIKRNNEDLAS